MAGGTLNFFSRLFSSKKKKILEKHRKEEVFDRSFIEKELQDKIDIHEVVKNESLGEFRGNSEEVVKESKRDYEDVAKVENEPVNHDYESNEIRQNLAPDYGDNKDLSAVSVIQSEVENEEIRKSQLQIESENVEEDSVHDDSLEYNSMVLLSKLEQLMIKLDDKAVQKSMPLVIEYLVEMANDVVEFARQLPGSESKKSVLVALLDRDEKIKVLNKSYVSNGQFAINISVIDNSDNPREMFNNIINDLLHLINIYLSASVKAFKSSQISEQWKTLYKGFFVNLTKSVQSSQANQ